MSTRPEPRGSSGVEIATRNAIIPGSVGLAQARPLTKNPAMREQPSAGLGTVVVHPTHSGDGPSAGRQGSSRVKVQRVVAAQGQLHKEALDTVQANRGKQRAVASRGKFAEITRSVFSAHLPCR